ncbi:MAG: VWA domain-containing protein [Nitrospirae bacterium]|nr:VWA domain-containing protein [Nitrospirota bacterium]
MAFKEDIRSELIQILGRTNFSLQGESYGLHTLIEPLLKLDTGERDEILKHGRLLAKTDSDLAFHFFLTAPDVLKEISIEDLPVWINKEIEFYDISGESDGHLRVDSAERIRKLSSPGLEFKKVEGILRLYEKALGDGLMLQEGKEAYTDTLTIFLPSNIKISDEEDTNLKAYKVIIAHKYGQVRYGTFRLRLDDIKKGAQGLKRKYKIEAKDKLSDFENFFNLFPEKNLAIDIYMILENIRIESLLCKEFKGYARDAELFRRLVLKERVDIKNLSPKERIVEGLLRYLMDDDNKQVLIEDMPLLNKLLPAALEAICSYDSSAMTSAEAAIEIYRLIDDNIAGYYNKLMPVFYYGVIKPETITEAEAFINKTIRDVIREAKEEIEEAEAGFLEGQDDRLKLRSTGWDIKEEREFTDEELENMGGDGEFLILEKKTVDGVSDEVRERIEKELSDLGEIDSSLLMRSLEKAGEKFKARFQTPAVDANIDAVIEKGPGVFVYDEWDFRMGRYRKDWCALREILVSEGSDKIIEDIQAKHSHLIHSIRRQFEAMRFEAKRLRRQTSGDEIDIDAVVEMVADIRAGSTPSDGLYTSMERDKRDVAAAIIVDISGSTDGWVLNTEREALVLLSEALEGIKDKYAIYAFSGRTRANCDFYIVKNFNDKYDDDVRRRIAGLKAGDYTRMGAPIRRLTEILNRIDAGKKLMITLSDGKPEDYDEYKGEYGIEDTRKALIEAKEKGITAFCITIDKEGAGYLPHMYGEANYTIIDSVEKLPLKIPQIYKRLAG